MAQAIAYGAGSVALLALLGLIFLGPPPAERGRYVVLACATTILWAAACAIDEPSSAGLTQVLEEVHTVAWLFFLSLLLQAGIRPENSSTLGYAGALVLALGAIA